MGQALGGGLPIIFNCMNNFYGMGGQPFGETMGLQSIARSARASIPEQMHAERVNGYDPLPVIDAFRRKKQMLREGRGPVLLETVTYRISGHSPSDASSYRSKEEIERWQQADSIRAFRAKLVAQRRAAEDGAGLGQRVRSTRRSSTCSGSPWTWRSSPRVAVDSELVGAVMFSNRRVEKFDERAPEFLHDLADNPRVQQIRGKIRTPTRRRQAGAEDEGLQRPRRAVRGDAASLLDRSRRWSRSAKRIATGAARSRSTAA